MESRTGHQKEAIAIFFEILAIYLGYRQNFVLENPQMRVSGQSARANPLHWSSINIFCTKNGFPVICGTRKNQSLVSSKIGGFACPQLYNENPICPWETLPPRVIYVIRSSEVCSAREIS